MWTSGFVAAGRYQLNEKLGEGGMGEVWSAVNRSTQRPVALKRLIVPRHEEVRGAARARFMLEAQSASAVDHPNVVQVLDFVEEPEGAPLIVMELLHGETLARTLEREAPLSAERTAGILLPVVSAVGCAHALGIVHRDLKPSNIFLSSGRGGELSVKVLDFGIAKWLDPAHREARFLTQTGATLGTPSYMAPEQATAERGVDHRADIWSLGVILYECLTGVRPVEGENAAQMVMRLLSSGIIPIQHLVPGLPAELAATIGRMLAREPRSRLEDLQQLFRVLQSLTHERAPAFGKPRLDAALSDRGVCELAPAVPPKAAAAPPVPGARPALPGRLVSRTLIAALALIAVGLFASVFLRSTIRDGPGPEVERATITPQPPRPAVVVTPDMSALLLNDAAATPEAPAASPTTRASSARASRSSAKPSRPNSSPARARPRTPGSSAPGALPLAPAPSAPARASGKLLPPGAPCDRSRECQSLLCAAFVCK